METSNRSARRPGYTTLEVEPTQLEQAVAHLVRLVDHDSTSGHEAGAVAEAETIAAELGLSSQRMPVAPDRDNLLVGSTEPRVIMCTHLDTVPPFIPAERDETTIHGRGSADAKGCGVAMLHALALLDREGAAQKVGCLLVVGEETDHIGARHAAASGLTPEFVILGEPCGTTPVVGQKGLLKLELKAQGTSGHSAYPDCGASAVHRLLEGLAKLRESPLPADPLLGVTTINVGQIAGGVAANVIAADAEAIVLVRCAAPVDAVLAEIVARLPPEVEATELNRAEPLEFHTLDEERGDAVPFNTDGHTLLPLGARLLLLGPGDMRCAHSPREKLAIADLKAGIEAYARLAMRLV